MKLPDQLKEIDLTKMKKAPIGFSGDEVYLVDDGYQGKDVVIKISNKVEVYHEGENFKWLKDYVKVPKVYFNELIDDKYYLVMEKLPGVMFQELFESIPLGELVIKYAKLLKQFHEINYQGLPFNHDLNHKIDKAHHRVITNQIKTEYFENEIKDFTGKQVYDLMIKNMPAEEDLVLCHGDVCLPNIMMDKNSLSGFIDIDGIGVCDRYLDIAIALRSLRYNFKLYGHNFEHQYIELFKETYGIKEPDCNKIKFYFLLDEL